MIDELEKRFCASLILDIKEQNVDVRGATIAVALAASALEQSLVEGDSSGVGLKSGDQTETRDKSIDPGTNTNASENKNTTNIAKSGEEQLRSDGRAVECAESGKDHVQGEEMPAKCIGDSNKEAVEPNKEDKEAFGDTNTKESIRDFALKLGYPRTDIDGALGKLGHLADKNSLLDELLKRSASAKQLEDGLCAAPSSEKVILPVEDADCLRSIAIDGSNVAMRLVRTTLLSFFLPHFSAHWIIAAKESLCNKERKPVHSCDECPPPVRHCRVVVHATRIFLSPFGDKIKSLFIFCCAVHFIDAF